MFVGGTSTTARTSRPSNRDRGHPVRQRGHPVHIALAPTGLPPEVKLTFFGMPITIGFVSARWSGPAGICNGAKLLESMAMLMRTSLRHSKRLVLLILLVGLLLPDLEAHADSDEPPGRVPKAPCYHTLEGLYAEAEALVQAYPDLVSLYAIGTSYEGRPLLLLDLTQRRTPPPKPFLFVVANAHGRELITSEVALAFARTLLEGYGTDADVTWILEQQHTYILLSLNPDGHVANEGGPPWPYWRKNRNSTVSCPTTYGVDLNRNFPLGWDLLSGASTYPCSNFYRGPAPFSEPETRALGAYLSELLSSRGVLTATSGASLYISLHAYGNGVIWPWAYTGRAAPDGAALSALGYRLAREMGYWGGQAANALYLMSGADIDWVYGAWGLPAYTFEVGPGGYGFFPPCSAYDKILAQALKGLKLAARLARSPYALAQGPEVTGLQLQMRQGQLVLEATLDDRLSGNQQIAAGRVFVAEFPERGTRPLPLMPRDGRWDQTVETVTAALPLDLPPGRYWLYVQGQDAKGAWGPLRALSWEVAVPASGAE